MMPAIFDLGLTMGRDPLCEEPGLRAQVGDALLARVVDARERTLKRPWMSRSKGDRIWLTRSMDAYFDGSGQAGTMREVLHVLVLGVARDEVEALVHNAREGAWAEPFVRRLRGENNGFSAVRAGLVLLVEEGEELEKAIRTAVELAGPAAAFALVAARETGVLRVPGNRVFPSEATGWTSPGKR